MNKNTLELLNPLALTAGLEDVQANQEPAGEQELQELQILHESQQFEVKEL